MSITQILPAYLYKQYDDDDDVRAFVDSQNEYSQEYFDNIYGLNIPVYTELTGPMLDWCALGVYGISRPSLPYGSARYVGTLNTTAFNVLAYNDSENYQSDTYSDGIGYFTIGTSAIGVYSPATAADYYITDDAFKRVLTWHLYKGDGKTFNVRWLKRRIVRFLTGDNGGGGTPEDTSRISIAFGTDNTVEITILNSTSVVTGGDILGSSVFSDDVLGLVETSTIEYTPYEYADLLKAAIEANALELPFGYTFTVTIS